ncbi:MAG: phosphate ABC transporter substrate-binding protein [Acidimicrobiales bacterium]
MRRRSINGLLAALALLGLAACGDDDKAASPEAGGTLRVSGSTTVNAVAADAAEVLRGRGLTITVDSQGGSGGGIAQLGAGQVEIAMSSKPIADADRQMFPSVDFFPSQIGADAVGIVVRREVVDGGLRNITRDQARDLFEGKVANWREFGGPDLAVFVYDKEPGRGTREVLDKYLYGSDGKAPPPPDTDNFAIVGGNEETRAKLLSTEGSVGPLSTSFISGVAQLVALPLDGVEAVPANVTGGTYPMARPLFLLTDGPPVGPAKQFIDFVLSVDGQKLVTKHGFLTRAELAPSDLAAPPPGAAGVFRRNRVPAP